MSRLFAAVWLPPSLVVQLRSLTRPERPGLRWTTEDQWHVTLRFFGQVDDHAEPVVQSLLAEAAALSGPVPVSAGPTPCRIGPAVWALPVEGLESLAGAIAASTGQVGLPPAHRRFRGHVTLARARRPPALADLPAVTVGDRWTVRDISLVRSDLHPEGARYQVVAHWALGPG